LNVAGFRRIDSSVIMPPWLQPMMPIRDGSLGDSWSSTPDGRESLTSAAVVDRVVERLAVTDARYSRDTT
jgi:hypothetical protein